MLLLLQLPSQVIVVFLAHLQVISQPFQFLGKKSDSVLVFTDLAKIVAGILEFPPQLFVISLELIDGVLIGRKSPLYLAFVVSDFGIEAFHLLPEAFVLLS